jgi:uridine kinase
MGRIVAISGAPGSGKSALARGLADALGDATVVEMDHYEQATAQPIEAIARWMEDGADYDALPVPLLAEHLAALRAGRTVTDPATHEAIRPAAWILFETQFGRAHRATGRHIDLLVWLDTPPDIALARTLLKSTRIALHDGQADAAQLAWTEGYLANYLTVVRQLILMQKARVGAGADIVLDGAENPDALIAHARDQILQRPQVQATAQADRE